MILLIWGIFAWGTWREDRKIKQKLDGEMEEEDGVEILTALHRRDMQIWVQLSLLLIVVAASDLHHDAALLPADFFAPPTPETHIITPKVPDSPDDKYDKILHKDSAALPFSNITEFNERNGKREAYIDWLKEHYESWLVTYYYLQKCGQVAAGDYDSIRHRLENDLSDAHADAQVESNILLAATGSYKEMYSAIPCDSAHYSSTKSTYDANMQQVTASPASKVADKGAAAVTPAPANPR